MQGTSLPARRLHYLGEIERCAAALKKNTKVADQIRVVEGPPETANYGALAQAELHLFIDHVQRGRTGIDNTVRATYFA